MRVQGRGDVEHGLEDVSALVLRFGRVEWFVGAGNGAWFTRSAIPVWDPETHLAGRRGLTAGVFRGPGREVPLVVTGSAYHSQARSRVGDISEISIPKRRRLRFLLSKLNHDTEGVAYRAGGGIGSEHPGAYEVQDRVARRPVNAVLSQAVDAAEYAERRRRSHSRRLGGA